MNSSVYCNCHIIVAVWCIQYNNIEMAFRGLTEADCGGANPVLELTGHLTSDHTLRDTYGYQAIPSEADQMVEQFLQESRAVPQTFHMDGRELIN